MHETVGPAPIPEPEEAEVFIEVPLQEQEEEQGQAEEERVETVDETALTNAEKELSALIEQCLEPITRDCMEWEKRVLHSANLVFFECSDAYKKYNRPTLPYPLLKHEQLLTKQRLTPTCPQEEIGGYEPISLDQWRTRAVMANQPPWRVSWFRKHPTAITTYARAPRELRIDPCYCPVRRKRTWIAFEARRATQPNWLNYPLLPAPEEGRQSTEHYMLTTLEQAINQFQGIPDLACMMLVKIAKMLITCIDGFHKSIAGRTPWTRFLEGRQGLSWNLQLVPNPPIIMGLFARLQFIESYHLQTFEDAFYTGFFEYQSHIFGPLLRDLGARIIAFQAMELQHPLRDVLEDARRERDYRRYLQGLERVNLQEHLDQQ